MFRTVTGFLACSWVVGLAWLSPLGGQVADPSTLEELGRRIEELRPRVDEALRRANHVDSVRNDSIREASRIPLDTLFVGPLRIVSHPGQVALAREVFTPLVEEFTPILKGSESLLSGQTFVFQYRWRMEWILPTEGGLHRVELSRAWPRRIMVENARAVIGQALRRAVPEEDMNLREWVGVGVLLSPRDWDGIYRELASTPALAARECYEGDLRWCWEAMGLSETDEIGRDWYSPAERRSQVESRFGAWDLIDSAQPSVRELLVRGCVLLRIDRACQLVFEGHPHMDRHVAGDYRIPLSGAARGSLAAEALRLGGVGSLSRLIANPEEPLKDRILAAAAVPPDTLMARWRARTLQARPNLHAGLLLSPLSLLLWILLIAALATRSTRWRLG